MSFRDKVRSIWTFVVTERIGYRRPSPSADPLAELEEQRDIEERTERLERALIVLQARSRTLHHHRGRMA